VNASKRMSKNIANHYEISSLLHWRMSAMSVTLRQI